MKLLQKISEEIYDRIEKRGLAGRLIPKETAERLFVNEDSGRKIREKNIALVRTILLVLIAAVITGVILLSSEKRILGENNTLKRAGPREGDKTYELEVSVAEKEHEKVSVLVTEREAEAGEIGAVFTEAESILRAEMLGENPSLQNVGSSLELIESIKGTKVTVSWEADEEGFFSGTGRLRIIPKEPHCVVIYATLHYFGHIRRIPIFVTIDPMREDAADEEEKIVLLENAVREADAQSPASESVKLPGDAGGETLDWREPADMRPFLILVLGIVSAVMVIPRARSSVRDEEKKRREQMERDYPEIVSKLILLLTAGMTCSAAWKRICNDYLASKEQLGKHFAYEEMVCSLKEFELGKSEAAVYESFGNRTGILCYKRLAAMLSRNLRRGSREILSMLDLESRDAYAARFEAVRKKGEETSTKLLLPMMGMLVIVIAIIVVPAFMGVGM